MKFRFSKIIDFFLIVFFIGLIFFFQDPLKQIYWNLEKQFSPCKNPITYSVGNFDKRFNISQEDFLNALLEAEQVWEQSIDKNLFDYNSNGRLAVNLIYDYRQEATQKLKELGFDIKSSEEAYSVVKNKYDSLQISYQRQKTELESNIKIFETQKRDLERQIDSWNKKGGAPPKEADLLEIKIEEVNNLAQKINNMQGDLNRLVDEINEFVDILNQLVRDLNLNVDYYNSIGEARGMEFQEGEYKSDSQGQEINIYQFEDFDGLVRVLAHELGHALGLDHLEDQEAIMYYLNEGQNGDLTPADLAELKRACKIKQ